MVIYMKQKKKNTYSGDSEELIKMGKILGSLLLALGIFYLLFGLITGEIKLKKEVKEVDISYDEILGGGISSISDSNYYVLLYDFKNEDFDKTLEIVAYQMKKTYKVDLGKGFNVNYLAKEESEKNLKTIESLKVMDPTLIEVSDKKIVKTFENRKDILRELLKQVNNE